MSLASPKAIADSVKAKLERFEKLYRTMYMRFFFKDFIHKEDVKQMMLELNKRITVIEGNLNTALAKAVADMNGNIAQHTHKVPQAPSGVLDSLPPAATFKPVAPPAKSAVAATPWIEVKHTSRVQELFAQGSALAPLASGLSLTATNANIDSTMTIVGQDFIDA